MRPPQTENRAAQERERELAEQARRQFERDFKRLMELPEFRRVHYALLELTNVFGTTFTGNSQTFHNEGRRSVGVELLEMARDLAPEAWTLEVAESIGRASKAQALIDAARAAEEDES